MENQFNSIQRIKKEIDELILQLSLGKNEAADFLEQQKERFHEILKDTKARIGENEKIDSNVSSKLKQQLDELRLQIELGKLESRDTLNDKRGKIEEAVSSINEDLNPLKEKAGELLSDIADTFLIGAESFKAQLDSYLVNTELGSTLDEKEIKLKKEEAQKRLKESTEKLKPTLEDVGKQIEQATAEAKSAFNDIKENLSSLLKS